jgi:hypothetical protein
MPPDALFIAPIYSFGVMECPNGGEAKCFMERRIIAMVHEVFFMY